MIRKTLIKLLKLLLNHRHCNPPLVDYPEIIDEIVFKIDLYTTIEISTRNEVRIKEVLMDYFKK
jgi:hypothetical protein